MPRGIITLPLESGKKELTWYVGSAVVNGTNNTSTTVPLRVDRDADFIARRMFAVMWPTYTAGGYTVDNFLRLPTQAQFLIRDGATKRALSLIAGNPRAMVQDADPAVMTSAYLGLPAPYMIRQKNNVFMEVTNPGASTTAWQGDLYLVLEGYKVYPNLPEDIPRTIEAYGVPYSLDVNFSLANPNAASANITGQVATVTNNGEGKFLCKGFSIHIVDNANADQTANVLSFLGLNVNDTSSGVKQWIQNPTLGQGPTLIPGPLLCMARTWLPFNTPRLIDENGVIQTQFLFSSIANALTYANTLSWPMTATLSFWGALIPR